MTEQERAARRVCYQEGVADTLAALMVAANAAIEHCEATAAAFAQERGVAETGIRLMTLLGGKPQRGQESGLAAETGARLMTAAAQQIRNIVTNVQAAQIGANHDGH